MIPKQRLGETVDNFVRNIKKIKSPTSWVSDSEFKQDRLNSELLNISREIIYCSDCKRLWVQNNNSNYIEFEQTKKNESFL